MGRLDGHLEDELVVDEEHRARAVEGRAGATVVGPELAEAEVALLREIPPGALRPVSGSSLEDRVAQSGKEATSANPAATGLDDGGSRISEDHRPKHLVVEAHLGPLSIPLFLAPARFRLRDDDVVPSAGVVYELRSPEATGITEVETLPRDDRDAAVPHDDVGRRNGEANDLTLVDDALNREVSAPCEVLALHGDFVLFRMIAFSGLARDARLPTRERCERLQDLDVLLERRGVLPHRPVLANVAVPVRNLVQNDFTTGGRQVEPLHREHLAVEDGTHLVCKCRVDHNLRRALRCARHRVAARVRGEERQETVNLPLLREAETNLPPVYRVVPIRLRCDGKTQQALIEDERPCVQSSRVGPVSDGPHLLGEHDLGGTDLSPRVAERQHPVVVRDAKVNPLVLEVDEATGTGLGEHLRGNLPRQRDASSVSGLRSGYGFTGNKVRDALPARLREHLRVGVEALAQLAVLSNLWVACLLPRDRLVVVDAKHRRGHVEVRVEARIDGVGHVRPAEVLEARLRERAKLDERVVTEREVVAGTSDEALADTTLSRRVLEVGLHARGAPGRHQLRVGGGDRELRALQQRRDVGLQELLDPAALRDGVEHEPVVDLLAVQPVSLGSGVGQFLRERGGFLAFHVGLALLLAGGEDLLLHVLHPLEHGLVDGGQQVLARGTDGGHALLATVRLRDVVLAPVGRDDPRAERGHVLRPHHLALLHLRLQDVGCADERVDAGVLRAQRRIEGVDALRVGTDAAHAHQVEPERGARLRGLVGDGVALRALLVQFHRLRVEEGEVVLRVVQRVVPRLGGPLLDKDAVKLGEPHPPRERSSLRPLRLGEVDAEAALHTGRERELHVPLGPGVALVRKLATRESEELLPHHRAAHPALVVGPEDLGKERGVRRAEDGEVEPRVVRDELDVVGVEEGVHGRERILTTQQPDLGLLGAVRQAHHARSDDALLGVDEVRLGVDTDTAHGTPQERRGARRGTPTSCRLAHPALLLDVPRRDGTTR